ncbi:phosphate acetyltransferase [Acididesulfobacillus acetoxydans]|uniref:Phosphate acetyltransferase n=1 Tax=Acididesulfobacillus acetoxydans TaxID=1561005 RepID=A0A8S0WEB2_9FIRM|nr:bifunctional enoyl-CoA hydratase/phosphate acetyltransferase [Acididesulfobacillus acetoxydans]CAA7599972.1 phosphate acetyltransferase [Acididesulfobacillus acetoxydans]CEJ07936.1 Phosphate butyryltransferase [Acididesulfobacillus acetoxydans]
MRFSNFGALLAKAKSLGRARVAVAAAADREVLEAVKLAFHEDLIQPVLVGDARRIREIAAAIELDLRHVEVVDEAEPLRAAHAAVDAVADHKAELLMKGLVNSSDFLRAVLRSERGLRTGRLLSHLAVFEVPGYLRLLFVTDGGMNIAPDLGQKKEILTGAVDYLHTIGMEEIKVAVLTANEMPSPKMPATMDAKALAEMNRAGEFAGAIVEGPLALDCAVSAAALKHKGLPSEIKGEADLFVVPSIEVGNVLGKSMVYFGGATMAGIVLGAQVPIVLTSRNDPPRSKLMSLAMAALSRVSRDNLQCAR